MEENVVRELSHIYRVLGTVLPLQSAGNDFVLGDTENRGLGPLLSQICHAFYSARRASECFLYLNGKSPESGKGEKLAAAGLKISDDNYFRKFFGLKRKKHYDALLCSLL